MTTWLRPALAELVGTFALIFIGAGSIIVDSYTGGGVGLVGVALAHGFLIAGIVSSIGHISGGHINPAVTVAFLVTRRIGVGLGALYIVSQLLGAVLAAFLLRALFPADAASAVNLGATALGAGIGFWQGVIIEAFLTFFLVFVVFGTAVDERGPKSIAGFGIGLVVAFDILAGGPLTGASMNPARTFGPALASGFWENHLLYWIGPLLGATIAAALYEYGLLRRT